MLTDSFQLGRKVSVYCADYRIQYLTRFPLISVEGNLIMKTIIRLLVILSIAFTIMTSNAYAVTLSLQPASQTASPTDTVFLDLVIDGLGNFAPDSLGAFDLDISYDPGALSFNGYTLGSLLGDPAFGEAIDYSLGDVGGGVINLAEVSLLESDSATCIFCFPPYLDDLQPGSFTLATLEFMVDVLPVGSNTTVSIDTVTALGDGFALPLTLEGTASATIRNPAGSTIPEPATLALIGFGLAAFGYKHRCSTKPV